MVSGPAGRRAHVRATVFVSMLLTLGGCTVNGHDPLSFKRDCRAAIERASPALQQFMATRDLTPVRQDPQVLRSLDECASSDLWISSAEAGLGKDASEFGAVELWQLVCVLKPDAPAGCAHVVPTTLKGSGS